MGRGACHGQRKPQAISEGQRRCRVGHKECLERALFTWRRMVDGIDGDNFLIGPPLVITSEQVDELLAMLEEGLAEYGKKKAA